MQCDKSRRAHNKSRWKFAENHRLCFCCLLNHGKGNCLSKKPCGVNGCTRKYHQMLHKDEKQPESIHNTNVPASQVILMKRLRLLLSMHSLLNKLVLLVQSCRSAVARLTRSPKIMRNPKRCHLRLLVLDLSRNRML
jgi:hypothetical protein